MQFGKRMRKPGVDLSFYSQNPQTGKKDSQVSSVFLRFWDLHG